MIEDFRSQFFSNTEPHTLTLTITSDDWATLSQIIEENEWEHDEGLRFILAAGGAYVQMSSGSDTSDGSSADRTGDVQQYQREVIDMRAQLAVMKYRAFQFMQAVHLLELKLNACEAEKALLQQANERLRQQLSDQQS